MSFANDLKFGLRGMRKNLGFTIVAVLTLAIAIGANSAIFSVVNGVLLRPLPYDHPERIVMIWESFDRFTGSASWPNFFDWRQQSTSFEAMGAFQPQDMTLQEGPAPERIRGGLVTADFFRVLGVQPLLGRGFASGEDQPTAQKTIVIDEGLWKTHFAGNPGILGINIRLNGEQFTVIGVMPAWVNYPTNAKVWIPNVPSSDALGARGNHGQLVIARLKPNISFARHRKK
jgi:putative ABC transport system permease protein